MAEKQIVTYFGRTIQEAFALRKAYYHDRRTFFLMLVYLKGRETAFLSASKAFGGVRHCKIHNVTFMESNFSAFDFGNKDYNIYFSLAHYVNHPLFSFASQERRRQQREWNGYTEEESGIVHPPDMLKFISGFDLAFDFDSHGKSFKDFRKGTAYRECKFLRDDLRKWGVQYRIIFSGNGFHLLVPFEAFKGLNLRLDSFDFNDKETLVGFVKAVRERMVNLYGLSSVDMSIVNIDRIFKAPWSFTMPYGTIAIPLTEEDFDNFDLSMAEPKNVLLRRDLYEIGQSGVFWTNPGIPGGFLDYCKKRLKAW